LRKWLEGEMLEKEKLVEEKEELQEGNREGGE